MIRRCMTGLLLMLTMVVSAQGMRYTNVESRFRIDYPNGYVAREGVMGTTVFILKPNQTGFSTNLNVIARRVPAGTSLSKETAGLEKLLADLITDFKLVSNQPSSLDGQPAVALLYTGRQGKYDLVWYQVIAIRSNISYVISFTAAAATYERDRVPLGNILGSFKFL